MPDKSNPPECFVFQDSPTRANLNLKVNFQNYMVDRYIRDPIQQAFDLPTSQ